MDQSNQSKSESSNLQEIFNTVIDHGFYCEKELYNYDETGNYLSDTRDYMCGALFTAHRCGVITEKEFHFAERKIAEYLALTGRAFLESALSDSGLPNSFNARKAIYQNWANRPTLKPEIKADPYSTI